MSPYAAQSRAASLSLLADGDRLGLKSLALPTSHERQQCNGSRSESPCVPLSPPARVPLHQGLGCASWRVPLPSQDQQAPADGSGQVQSADGGAARAQAPAERQTSVSGAAETLRGRYSGWPFGTTLPQQDSVRSQVGDTIEDTVAGRLCHIKPRDVGLGGLEDPMNELSLQSRMQQMLR